MMSMPVMNFRPPAYRPFQGARRPAVPVRPVPVNQPSMDGNPSRARLGAFAAKELPLSILLVSGGAAGFYAASLAPEPFTTILRAAGIGIIGYGIYNAFSGPETETVSKPAGGQEAQMTPSASAFEQISGTFITPLDGQKPEENTWSRTFDAQIAWFNKSPENVSFTYDILTKAVSSGIPVEGQNVLTKSVGTQTVKLKAGQDSGPLMITIPIFRPPNSGISGWGLPSPTFSMDLQLRKYGPGGPVPTGNSIRVGPWDWYSNPS